jgi:ribose transport system substrate-binding protein
MAIGGALVATVAVLTACSTPSGSASSAGASSTSRATTGPAKAAVAAAQAVAAKYASTPAGIPVTTPLRSVPPKGKTLIFLTQDNVPGVVKLGQGEQQAAAAIGWKFSEVNYDQSNPATLQSALSTALIKHPTVVSITGTDPSEIGASTLHAYAAAGIPIVDSTAAGVTVTKTLLGDPGGPESYTASAQAAAAWFVADSGGTGKALVATVSGITILGVYASAFAAEVKTLCPSSCSAKIVPVPVASAVGGQEPGLVVAALRSNPEYKYLFFDDGDFGIGINSALSSAGITGVKIGGGDFQPQEAAALKAGTQSMWTGENLVDIGYTAVDVALRYVEGMPITQDSNPQPVELMTQSNIGNATDFQQPANALQQWETLWHVSSGS